MDSQPQPEVPGDGAHDEAEWLQWRRGGITATEVADAATGMYGGAYAVVGRKLGVLPSPEVTDAMNRGHRWQPRIADAVHHLTGWYVVGEETWCEHAVNDRWRATVDGFLATTPEATLDDVVGVLEVKTRGLHTQPPRQRWEDQVQWQMLVTGLDAAVIAEAAIDDTDDTLHNLYLKRVTADPLRQSLLIETATSLLAKIDAGTLPDPDTPSALPLVKTATAEADADTGVVDLADLADEVRRFSEIKAAVKAVTDERDEIEARIRARMGESTKGVADGWTVSVSKPALVLTADAEAELLAARPDLGRMVLDRDKAKAEAPELYDAHRRAAGARRLTIRQPKGDN